MAYKWKYKSPYTPFAPKPPAPYCPTPPKPKPKPSGGSYAQPGPVGGGGGTYNPSSGVYTAPTGEKYSTATAPPGSKIDLTKPTIPTAAGKIAVGQRQAALARVRIATQERFDREAAEKKQKKVGEKTAGKTTTGQVGQVVAGKTSPFPAGTTPQQIAHLAKVSKQDIDYAVKQQVLKEQLTWGGLPHEEYQKRRAERIAEVQEQYKFTVETAKQVHEGTYEEPEISEPSLSEPISEPEISRGVKTYTGLTTQETSVPQPTIIEPIIQTSSIISPRESLISAFRRQEGLAAIFPTEKVLLTAEDLQLLYEQQQEQEFQKGFGGVFESAIIKPIETIAQAAYDIIKPEETYVVEEKYAAGEPAGYVVGYEPSIKEGVPYAKPIIEYHPVLLSRTEERLSWAGGPEVERSKGFARTQIQFLRGIASAAPALVLFGTDIARTGYRAVSNPLGAPDIIAKKAVGIGTGFYEGFIENPQLVISQAIGSYGIGVGFGKVIPIKYQPSTYIGKAGRYVASKLPAKIQVKLPVKLQTFKGERLIKDVKLGKYTKTYVEPPKFAGYDIIKSYSGFPEMPIRVEYVPKWIPKGKTYKTFLRRTSTKPIEKTRIWGRQLLEIETIVKGKKGISGFDATEHATIMFKEKTGTYATPKDILRLKDVSKRISGYDVQRIQHVFDKFDDSVVWRTNVELGKQLKLEYPLIETKISKAIIRPKVDLSEAKPLSGYTVTELKLSVSDIGKAVQKQRFGLEVFTKEKTLKGISESGAKVVKSTMTELARQKSFDKFLASFKKEVEVIPKTPKSPVSMTLKKATTVREMPVLKPIEIFPKALPQMNINIPTTRATPLLKLPKKFGLDTEDTFRKYVKVSEGESSPLGKSRFGSLLVESAQYGKIGTAWAGLSGLLKMTKTGEKIKTKPIEIIESTPKIRIEEKTKIITTPKQGVKLRQKQMQRQEQLLRTLLRQRVYQPQPSEFIDVPEPAPPIIIYGDDEKKKKKRLSSLLGFDVFVKTRRKTGFREFEETGFEKVSKKPLTRASALGLGAFTTRRSPAMTFLIEKTRKPGLELPKFKDIWKSDQTKFREITGREKQFFIQTRESAIGTPEEIEQISLLGAKTRRKSALDFRSVL